MGNSTVESHHNAHHYFNYSYNELKYSGNQDYTSQFLNFKFSKTDLTIFHQNIKGLNISKMDELLISPSQNSSHIICLTEHHLCDNALDTMVLTKYNLGAKFCRNLFKKGGVCIFNHESIQFTNINLGKFCKEKDLEVCAAKVRLSQMNYALLLVIDLH
jgi:hypothetical protein